MNFIHMPERDWVLGYPLSVVLMGISAVLLRMLAAAGQQCDLGCQSDIVERRDQGRGQHLECLIDLPDAEQRLGRQHGVALVGRRQLVLVEQIADLYELSVEKVGLAGEVDCDRMIVRERLKLVTKEEHVLGVEGEGVLNDLEEQRRKGGPGHQ